MTAEHLDLLKSSIDEVVLIETTDGERILARILSVFDGEDTPDVFYLEVEPAPDGSYTQKGRNGYSSLLADILAVHPSPRT